MVKSIFEKITDAKRFLCYFMMKNTPAERKSPWDNHKSFRSTTSITISLCEFLALEICPRLAVFGDVRFDSDLWGRRTPGVVVEVQPVDYFHMTCVRRWKFLFAFCGVNSQFQFAFCFFYLRLPVSTCLSSFRLAFDVLTF